MFVTSDVYKVINQGSPSDRASLCRHLWFLRFNVCPLDKVQSERRRRSEGVASILPGQQVAKRAGSKSALTTSKALLPSIPRASCQGAVADSLTRGTRSLQ